MSEPEFVDEGEVDTVVSPDMDVCACGCRSD